MPTGHEHANYTHIGSAPKGSSMGSTCRNFLKQSMGKCSYRQEHFVFGLSELSVSSKSDFLTQVSQRFMNRFAQPTLR